MTRLRVSHQRDAVKVTGRGTAGAAMLRTCPTCGAGPNQSCRREVGARVRGADTGGGYTVRLKNVHKGR